MDIEYKCQEIWETLVGHEGSPAPPADPLETLHPYQVIWCFQTISIFPLQSVVKVSNRRQENVTQQYQPEYKQSFKRSEGFLQEKSFVDIPDVKWSVAIQL